MLEREQRQQDKMERWKKTTTDGQRWQKEKITFKQAKVLTEFHVDVLVWIFLPQLLIFILITHQRKHHLLSYSLQKNDKELNQDFKSHTDLIQARFTYSNMKNSRNLYALKHKNCSLGSYL